ALPKCGRAGPGHPGPADGLPGATRLAFFCGLLGRSLCLAGLRHGVLDRALNTGRGAFDALRVELGELIACFLRSVLDACLQLGVFRRERARLQRRHSAQPREGFPLERVISLVILSWLRAPTRW